MHSAPLLHWIHLYSRTGHLPDTHISIGTFILPDIYCISEMIVDKPKKTKSQFAFMDLTSVMSTR